MNYLQQGVIRISSLSLRLDPNGIAEMFKQLSFVPIRIEWLLTYDVSKYTGISYMFDELKEGDKIPEYEVTLEKTKNGKIKVVKVERLEERDHSFKIEDYGKNYKVSIFSRKENKWIPISS